MNLSIFYCLIVIFAFSACGNNDNKNNSIEQISIHSLHKSNEVISELSNAHYKLLSEKLRNSIYGERPVIWNSKAIKLKATTELVIKQVELLNKNNVNEKLHYLKNTYLREVETLDSALILKFKKDIDSFSLNYEPNLSLTFILEKIKNDFLLLESKFSGYFNNQVGVYISDYTSFSCLIGQNTTHLKSGETLEISAGIGAFTLAANPSFVINGKILQPDENARAIYKLEVSGKGKKAIPIKILYTSSKGEKESKEFNVEYFID
jgi:hypothetical protein